LTKASAAKAEAPAPGEKENKPKTITKAIKTEITRKDLNTKKFISNPPKKTPTKSNNQQNQTLQVIPNPSHRTRHLPRHAGPDPASTPA
jgi:hypothetical protein